MLLSSLAFAAPADARFLQADPVGVEASPNLYMYVSNDPLNNVDPNGLWQFTLSGGWGLGGTLTFGKNAGQWNVGGWIGGGTGLSGRLNIFDTGPSAAGYDVSWKGQANWRLESVGGGGFGNQHSFFTGTDVVNFSYTITQGINILLTAEILPDYSIGKVTVFPTAGGGTSAFLGIGGTWASSGNSVMASPFDIQAIGIAAQPTASK
jgi:hypothetical protein